MESCSQRMALVGVLSTHGTLKPTSIPQNRMSCAGTSSFSSSSMAEKPPSPAEQSTVDNIISGILKAVNEEEPYVCSSCRSGTSSAVSVWNGHSISSNSRCSSMASYSPQSLSPTPSFCDRHHEPLRFICETCMLPLCSECVTPDHRCHQIVSMQDATDKARTIAVQMQTEVMVLKTSVREAADTAQRMSESLEVRSHQARLSVQTTIRRAIQALQERECELISMINNISQSKSRILVTQMENFNTTLLGLSRLMDCLSESIDKGNSLEVISTARNAQSEVTRLRFTCTDLNPHEDDRITFVAPDASFLRALSSLGSVNTTNGRYVSARSLRENSSQIRPFVPRIALNRELECEPQGRPIFGMISAVICKEPLSVIPYLIFGSEGSEDGKLCRPWGVCCHRSGKLIVADRSNNRIQVFNGDGTYSHKFGSKGSECGQFEKPAGVAVDPQDRIVVADKDNHRIQVFQMDGTFLLTFGQKGQRHGQFSYPWDVACNSLSQIVVSDTRNHRVQLFTPDGAFINKYGFDGNGMLWKQFDSPRGVCFTPTGHIVVTDFNNHRIVVIDPAMNNAQYLGTEGSNQMQFMRPQGVVCDDEGRIIVADSRNNRIQVLNSSGTHLWQIGRSGKGPGEFDRPSGICLNPEGRIVVVDFANERVQIF